MVGIEDVDKKRRRKMITDFAEIRSERRAIRSPVLVTRGADAGEDLAAALWIACER